MKNLILFLPLILLACSKQDIRQPKHFGVIGNVDQDYAKFRKGRGKPVKDTVVTTPPPTDSTPVVVDTVPTVDPVPVFPASYEIPMPTPLNQGSEGSCVSFSIVYAREREQFNKTGQWTRLSQEFLFDLTTNDHVNCSASGIITATEFLKTTGVCTAFSLPYSWTNGCSADTTGLTKEANQYRINNYIIISASDMTGLKQALSQNHPLVIQITPDQSFLDATAGFIWKVSGTPVAVHSLAVCGYDDSKHAYKIINSWGTNWGDSGYGWIDYDLFPKVSSSAMKMIL